MILLVFVYYGVEIDYSGVFSKKRVLAVSISRPRPLCLWPRLPTRRTALCDRKPLA